MRRTCAAAALIGSLLLAATGCASVNGQSAGGDPHLASQTPVAPLKASASPTPSNAERDDAALSCDSISRAIENTIGASVALGDHTQQLHDLDPNDDGLLFECDGPLGEDNGHTVQVTISQSTLDAFIEEMEDPEIAGFTREITTPKLGDRAYSINVLGDSSERSVIKAIKDGKLVAVAGLANEGDSINIAEFVVAHL